MAKFTCFFDDPIPERSSEMSRRMLHKARHTRRMAGLMRPKGIRLRLLRKLGGFIVPRRPVLSGTVREVTHGRSGLLVTGEGADPARGVLLWIHGGGLLFGDPETEQWLAGRYSARTGMSAFLPRYRLAPEHPFPAAVDDVLAAYRGLLDAGFPAEQIRLCGGSAGGYLALVLLGDISRAGLPMPAAVLLQSPSVDISGATARRRDAEYPEPLYSPKISTGCSRLTRQGFRSNIHG